MERFRDFAQPAGHRRSAGVSVQYNRGSPWPAFLPHEANIQPHMVCGQQPAERVGNEEFALLGKPQFLARARPEHEGVRTFSLMCLWDLN